MRQLGHEVHAQKRPDVDELVHHRHCKYARTVARGRGTAQGRQTGLTAARERVRLCRERNNEGDARLLLGVGARGLRRPEREGDDLAQ